MDSASILAAAKAQASRRIPVSIPEWSDDPDEPLVLYVTKLTVGELKQLSRMAGDDASKLTLMIVIRKTVDENGEQLFDEGDRGALRDVSASVIGRLADAAMGATDVKEAVKN